MGTKHSQTYLILEAAMIYVSETVVLRKRAPQFRCFGYKPERPVSDGLGIYRGGIVNILV